MAKYRYIGDQYKHQPTIIVDESCVISIPDDVDELAAWCDDKGWDYDRETLKTKERIWIEEYGYNKEYLYDDDFIVYVLGQWILSKQKYWEKIDEIPKKALVFRVEGMYESARKIFENRAKQVLRLAQPITVEGEYVVIKINDPTYDEAKLARRELELTGFRFREKLEKIDE